MQKRTKLFLGAGAAALLALGGLAGLAQADMRGGGHGMCSGMHGGKGRGHGMMGQQMMERYDANKDGKLTQQEIDDNRQQWLAEADADKNGTLSLEEFKVLWLKARNEMMVREFQFFDRDGNGQVTIEEYKGPLSGIVAARDRNDDGSLGADDRPGGEGPTWRYLRPKGHGMMGEGMMGRGMGGGMGGGQGPCMQEDDGAAGGQGDSPSGQQGGAETTP